MGMFDDLIPSGGAAGAEPMRVTVYPNGDPRNSPGEGEGSGGGGSGPRAGMFDDLVPVMDFGRPIEDVRADVNKLTGPTREHALRQWADHFVANERANGGVGMALDNTVRTLTRGTFVGPFIDEANAATQAGLHAIGMGGAPYDEALAYQRARDRAVDTDYPIASIAGQVVGGLAGGGAALKAGGLAGGIVGGPLAAVTPAKSVVGNVAQGAGVGAAYGAVSGFGNAEGGSGDLVNQGVNRLGGALEGAGVGGIVGGVAAPVITGATKAAGAAYDAASPVIARYSQEIANAADATKGALRDVLQAAGVVGPARRPSSGGSAAAPPPATVSGAEAAAEQIIANQLARANVSPADLRQRLLDARQNVQFGPNSFAQDVTAPVDLDRSLQRLAGSVARQSPEAGNMADSFIAARQTGITPREAMPEYADLPTRAMLARPDANAPPMGQFERVRDALARSMGVSGSASKASAYQTEQQITETASREANRLYGEAYDAGNGISISNVIRPVMERWAADTLDKPPAMRAAVRRALAQFTSEKGPVNTLQLFDQSKQTVDDQIEELFRKGSGFLGGLVRQVKNDMLAAVDGVQANDMGAKYAAARDAFSSHMEMRDALNLGRSLFKEHSEAAIHQFRDLATEGERRMARLGIVESFVNLMSRQKRTADVTQIFQQPRIQQILEAMIPRPRGANAMFADRQERLGRYLDNESRMITGTRNEVMGNSKTAQRLADDESLNEMMSLVDTARKSPSATSAAMQIAADQLNKLFGFRADTAAEIATKLFTVNVEQRDRLLRALDNRLGPTRMAHLTRLLQENQARLIQASGTASGSPPPSEPTPPAGGYAGPPRRPPPSTGQGGGDGDVSGPELTGGSGPAEAPAHHSNYQPRGEGGQFAPGKPTMDATRRATARATADQFDRPTPQDSGAPVDRGGIVPVGTYPDGRTGVAFPQAIAAPVESAQRLMQRGYQAGTEDRQGVEDAANVTGLVFTGARMFPQPAGSGLGAITPPKGFPPAPRSVENAQRMFEAGASRADVARAFGMEPTDFADWLRYRADKIENVPPASRGVGAPLSEARQSAAVEATVANARRLFDEGKTRPEVAAAFGMTSQEFQAWLKTRGDTVGNVAAPTRGTNARTPDDTIQTIADLLRSGVDRADLPRQLNMSKDQVRKILQNHADRIRSAAPKPASTGQAPREPAQGRSTIDLYLDAMSKR